MKTSKLYLNRFFPKKKLGLISATVLLTFLPQNVVSGELSSAECKYIEAYNLHSKIPFLEQFSSMVHIREICPTGINCEGLISKRTEPINFYFISSDTNKRKKLFNANALYLSGFIKASTNLPLTIGKDKVPHRNSSIVVIEFDGKFYEHAQVWKNARKAKLLKNFKADKKVDCLAVNFNWDKLEYSEVWIKSHVNDEVFANCLKEEVYATLGVHSDPIGNASIFSDKKFQEPNGKFPLYTPISSREFIILKLLYQNKIKNGQSQETSSKIIDEYLVKQCNLKG